MHHQYYHSLYDDSSYTTTYLGGAIDGHDIHALFSLHSTVIRTNYLLGTSRVNEC